MPKFKIPVTLEMCEEFEVEAETIEDAIMSVEDNENDKYNIGGKGEYVDGSFCVDENLAYDMNNLPIPYTPYDHSSWE